MELIRVVYHNGCDFHSGHYTCLCRGPGGRFWSYDDAKPVHREDRDIAHIKPKQVVLVVYGRSDGGATFTRSAVGGADIVAARIDEAVGVLDADPQAVPGHASCSSPRRLRRKTSCEAPSSAADVELAMSPPSRRLSRKTSATEASVAGPCGAVSPVAAFASPSSRRLRRKVSAEEAAVGTSPASVLPSPGSRRLRRKTSAEEVLTSGSVPVDRVDGPGAASVVVVGAEERTDRFGDVGRDDARGGQVGDALGQGRVMATLRRGRGRGGQTGSQRVARDAGVSRQDDAAAWFLAAADMDGGSGVVE